jgi:hypothetical protein
LSTAALIVWLITAVFGLVMLAIWVVDGGHGPNRFSPVLIFAHFMLAGSGLIVWVAYLFSDDERLAWVAFGDLVVVGVLGDFTLFRWLRLRRSAAAAAAAAVAAAEGAVPAPAATSVPVGSVFERAAPPAPSVPAPPPATAPRGSGRHGRPQPALRFPLPVVVIHGLLAATTITLVLLSALGVGES